MNREDLYKLIQEQFEDNFEGENKDGVFLNFDGVQFNIKVTQKRKPVDFGKSIPHTSKENIDTLAAKQTTDGMPLDFIDSKNHIALDQGVMKCLQE